MSPIYDHATSSFFGPRYIDNPAVPPTMEAVVENVLIEGTQAALQRVGVPCPPNYYVQDGMVNAFAYARHTDMRSGIDTFAVPGVYLHEHSHWMNGDSHNGLPTYLKEIRADWGAGYRLAQLGLGEQLVQATCTQMANLAGGDHNSAEERVNAVRAGVAAAQAGIDFSAGGNHFMQTFAASKRSNLFPAPFNPWQTGNR